MYVCLTPLYSLFTYVYFSFYQRHMSNADNKTFALEYVATVLYRYFKKAGVLVEEFDKKEWGVDCIGYVLRQLDALWTQGVEMDCERYYDLAALQTETCCNRFRSKLMRWPHHPMVRAYLDIEGTPDRPIEVGLIFAKGLQIECIYHAIIYQEPRNPSDIYGIERVHGIRGNTVQHKGENEVRQQVAHYLRFYRPTEIFVNGKDIEEFIPNFTVKIKQVEMLPWSTRPSHYSHHLARIYKEGNIARGVRYNCVPANHRWYKGPTRLPLYRTERHKELHGHHCAVADALELLHFVAGSPDTRMVSDNFD